jgi:hypothetical protein
VREAFEKKRQEDAEQLELQHLKRVEKRKKRKEAESKAKKESKLAKLNTLPTDGSFMDMFLKMGEQKGGAATEADGSNSDSPREQAAAEPTSSTS